MALKKLYTGLDFSAYPKSQQASRLTTNVHSDTTIQVPDLVDAVLYVIWGPFYLHGLTLIPAWIRNHMPSKMWDEITYPLPNFNGFTVEVWESISHFIP